MKPIEDSLAKILILVLLQRLPTRSNSYDLSRILEWKFQYFDYKRIIKELEMDEFIGINTNSVDEYFIKEKGEQFIKDNMEKFKNKIINSSPAEIEFLSVLLK